MLNGEAKVSASPLGVIRPGARSAPRLSATQIASAASATAERRERTRRLYEACRVALYPDVVCRRHRFQHGRAGRSARWSMEELCGMSSAWCATRPPQQAASRRLGISRPARPTFILSPHMSAGKADKTLFDHTSIRKTILVQRVIPMERGLEVRTNRGRLSARQVVVATGSYHTPRIPRPAASISRRVLQIHSHEYRNAAALPDGAVLMVGSGQTGHELAEELQAAGRRVYLAPTADQLPDPRRRFNPTRRAAARATRRARTAGRRRRRRMTRAHAASEDGSAEATRPPGPTHRRHSIAPHDRVCAPDETLPAGVFELGVVLYRPRDRGKGYGREAVWLLTNWLFEAAGAERVQAGTEAGYRAMRAVL
jgi:Pyridine nucleotide-disulphide oxidoreductase/Acetyltransferase (GNAT) domain